MHPTRRFPRFFALAAAAFALAANFTTPPRACAQYDERSVELNPTTGAVNHGARFFAGNGFHVTLPPVATTATAIGSTTVFTVPQGAYIAPSRTGGVVTPASTAVLEFHATGVEVEYTAATGVTAGATFRVGTAANDTAVLGSTTLANTATAGTFQRFPAPTSTVLKTGDTIIFKITGAATATSQALKVHVSGYYQ